MKNKIDLEQELLENLKALKKKEYANPSLLFRENSKKRLMNIISDEASVENKASSFVFFRNPKFAFRFATALIIIFLITSSGTILAAQNASPNSSLYPLKLASEKTLLNISPTSSLKAKVSVEIVKRRESEISPEHKETSTAQYKSELDRYRESIEEAKKYNSAKELEDDEKNLEELLQSSKKQDTQEKPQNTIKPRINEQPIEQDKQEVKSAESQNVTSHTETNTSVTNQTESVQKTIDEVKTNIENALQNPTSSPSHEQEK